MTPEQVWKVIQKYRERFEALGISPQAFSHGELVRSPESTLEHCYGMLSQMEVFLKEGRMEKALCWLGFVQGCLWAQGLYSLDELKEDNRP